MIRFEKDVPTYVPPECRKEVLMFGAVAMDGNNDILDPELQEVPELSLDERNEQMIAAFKVLQARNSRDDFTGQGVPSVPALKKIVDFTLDRKEVEVLWREYIEEQNT
jgi:hypothetical protein